MSDAEIAYHERMGVDYSCLIKSAVFAELRRARAAEASLRLDLDNARADATEARVLQGLGA
jgi:hypothetical protein